MKPHHLTTLCDSTYALLGAAEAAERDPKQFEREELRRLLEPMLQAALPLFTMEEIERMALDGALAAHKGNRVAAAEALGISRRTLYNHLGRSEAA